MLKIPDRMPTVAPVLRARDDRGYYELGWRINYAVADAFPVLFGVMRGDAPPPYPADRRRRATV
jgi:hypothetical protein